jgi:rhamnosyltransferase
MRLCRGELVVLLVQDALPLGPGWLRSLTAPLAEPCVGAATARQVAGPDAAPVVRAQLAQWPAAAATPWRSEPLDDTAFARLAPAERLRRALVDDVCACLRRRAWEQVPFPDVAIAEDVGWARRALAAGWALAYAPDAVVEHAHDRAASAELRRTRLLHRELACELGLTTIPDLPQLAIAIASSLAAHARATRHQPSRLPRALALAVAWPLGQYLGARAARQARSSR